MDRPEDGLVGSMIVAGGVALCLAWKGDEAPLPPPRRRPPNSILWLLWFDPINTAPGAGE